jgi:hypothetical protein
MMMMTLFRAMSIVVGSNRRRVIGHFVIPSLFFRG